MSGTAYLVLAHHDVTHLMKLLRRLAPAPVLVHWDASRLAALEAVAMPDHVTLLDDGVAVTWGGFSAVEAMLRLSQAARERFPDAHHYVFLSGECYPIRDPREFDEYLSEMPNTLLCRAFNIQELGGWHVDRVNRIHLFDDLATLFPHARWLRRGLRCLAARFLPKRNLSSSIVACGSQWMALTGDCIDDLLLAWREGKFEAFRRTFAPDEMVIQTFVHTTSWSSHTLMGGLETPRHGKVSDLPNFHALKPSMSGHFTEKDLAHLLESNQFFARKVGAPSGSLIDDLDGCHKP